MTDSDLPPLDSMNEKSQNKKEKLYSQERKEGRALQIMTDRQDS
jgi:hypothetical protein